MARPDRIGSGIGKTARMAAGVVALMVAAGTGCGSIRVTDTPRSATEQLLLTDSWDQAIGAIDFSPFIAMPVHLDDSLLNGVDKNWMVYRLRETMARQGLVLVDDRDEADVVIEAAAGVYGTDSDSFMIGLPANNLIGMLPFAPPASMGEAALANRTDQYGVTRLALFARDAATGHFLWESGTIDADSYLRNGTVVGIPFRAGTIEHPSDRRRRHQLRRAADQIGLPTGSYGHHEFKN